MRLVVPDRLLLKLLGAWLSPKKLAASKSALLLSQMEVGGSQENGALVPEGAEASGNSPLNVSTGHMDLP